MMPRAVKHADFVAEMSIKVAASQPLMGKVNEYESLHRLMPALRIIAVKVDQAKFEDAQST